MLTAELRKGMNDALREIVDAASVGMYANDAPREHLGASVIGEDCAAKVWYQFRWARHGRHEGQQLRLFNTGHLYEARFIKWYRDAGFEVRSHSETGEQIRISACDGHFGGSLDSEAIYRGVNREALANIIGWQQAEKFTIALAPLLGIPVVLEFKTHNRDNFAKLKKNSVRLSHPKHFTQFSTYGYFRGYEYSIYAGYCKDNDEFWPEVHRNDFSLGEDMIRKATEIIAAKERPQRISENETYYECKWCQFVGICHHGDPMQKNCRSCRHAYAGPDKSWICSFWEHKTIPHDYLPLGCGQWAQLT